MKEHFPRWPTRSPDPWVNILCVTVFVFFGILALATSLILLMPIALVFAVIALWRWSYLRPQGYSNPAIVAAVNQHTIAANFPDTQTFTEAYVERLTEAWHPRIPTPQVMGAVANVAAEIYAVEALTNPLPPLPTDEVDQGRWRDEARIHAQKMQDAPTTLAVFTDILTQSLATFRNELPAPALVDRTAFNEWGDRVPALSIPAHLVFDMRKV